MTDLHLLRPYWLLALLPLVALLWRLWRYQAGGSAWARVVDAHLLPHVLRGNGGDGRRMLALLAAGWLLAVLALAGPTWMRTPVVVFQAKVPPLVLVVDLSRSMTASDVAPTRLGFIQALLAGLLDRLPPRPVGVVAYAGSGHVVLPPADDPRLVRNALAALSAELPPLPGSVPAAGLAQARELVNRAEHGEADVLLVADGGDAAAEEAAAGLARAGLRVSVLAVGTPTGTIRLGEHTVPVPLDEERLRAVAHAGGGGYLRWDGELTGVLEALSAGRAAPLDAKDSRIAPVVWRDGGRWLVLLLLPLAALAFRRGWLGMVLLAGLAAPPPAEAFDWADLWLRPEQRAARLVRRGEPAPPEVFGEPLWQGAALYRSGDYAGAAEAFGRAEGAEANYNRGNALLRLGRLRDAREAYEMALTLQPEHADARFNLRLVKEIEQDEDDGTRRKPAPARDMRPPPEAPQAGGPAPERAASQGTGGGELQAEPGEMPETQGGSRQGEGGGGKGAGETASSPGPSGEGDGDRSSAAGAEPPSPRQEPAQPSDGGASSSADAQAPAQLSEPRAGGSGTAPPEQPPPEADEASLPPAEGDDAPQGPDTRGRTGAPGGQPKDDAEYQQALEQWLERVPDDSAAFLRELFRRQHDKSRAKPAGGPPW